MINTASRRTPPDRNYPSCAEVQVSLLVYTGAMHPASLSEHLGVPGVHLNVKGDTVVNRLGRSRTPQNNFFELSSEDHVKSLDVRHHLDWLIQVLDTRQLELLKIQEYPEVCMSVNCVWYSRGGHGGPTLWPEQMRALADLNLECSFDIYILDEE